MYASERDRERGGGEALVGFSTDAKETRNSLMLYCVMLNDMLDNACMYMRNYSMLVYVGIEKRG